MLGECYEVDPFSFSDQLKSTLKIINPFERILKEIDNLLSDLRDLDENDPIERKKFENKLFNRKNFENFVEDYYIYKIQYKKYGLTFLIKEEIENDQSDNKSFFSNGKKIFVNESYSNDLSDFFDNDIKEYLRRRNYSYKLVTLEQQKIIPNFQLGKKVVKYIDPERLYKIKRTKETLLSMREIINLNRIIEIPYLFKKENYKRYGEKNGYYENKKNQLKIHQKLVIIKKIL